MSKTAVFVHAGRITPSCWDRFVWYFEAHGYRSLAPAWPGKDRSIEVRMHRGAGASSLSAEATDFGRQHGVTVIDGGCPLMFGPTADFGHRLLRLVYSSKVPKQV